MATTDLTIIDGIGAKFKERIQAAGYSDVEALLAFLESGADKVAELSTALGTQEYRIQKWYAQARLLHLSDMTEAYFQLMNTAKVRNLEAVSEMSAEGLLETLTNVGRDENAPSAELCAAWVKEAAEVLAGKIVEQEAAGEAAVADYAGETTQEPPAIPASAGNTAQEPPAIPTSEEEGDQEFIAIDEEVTEVEIEAETERATEVEVEIKTEVEVKVEKEGSGDDSASQQSPKRDPEEIVLKNSRKVALMGLIPIPILDMVVIDSQQEEMVAQLCSAYETDYLPADAKSIIKSLAPFDGSIGVITSLAKLIPFTGSITGGISSLLSHGAETYGIGKTLSAHFQEGGKLEDFNSGTARESFKTYYREGWEKLSHILAV